jgi:hypothetical protein
MQKTNSQTSFGLKFTVSPFAKKAVRKMPDELRTRIKEFNDTYKNFALPDIRIKNITANGDNYTVVTASNTNTDHINKIFAKPSNDGNDKHLYTTMSDLVDIAGSHYPKRKWNVIAANLQAAEDEGMLSKIVKKLSGMFGAKQ